MKPQKTSHAAADPRNFNNSGKKFCWPATLCEANNNGLIPETTDIITKKGMPIPAPMAIIPATVGSQPRPDLADARTTGRIFL